MVLERFNLTEKNVLAGLIFYFSICSSNESIRGSTKNIVNYFFHLFRLQKKNLLACGEKKVSQIYKHDFLKAALKQTFEAFASCTLVL